MTTQGEHAQPEALRLAAELRDGNCGIRSCLEPSANELERLHYENKGLRAQVAALTAAPQGGAYAELPAAGFRCKSAHGAVAYIHDVAYQDGPATPIYNADQMRAFADATHALRASHGQAPAGAEGDRKKWEQQVNDLIDEYGDELATEACHGELHCRQSPARIREQIRVLLSAPTAQPAPAAFQRALDIRIAQGWKLGGDKVPVLYTDSINGEQVCRDDLWLCTTAALAAAPTPAAQQGGAAIQQLVDALENHAGNYKLTQAEAASVNAAIDAERAALAQKEGK